MGVYPSDPFPSFLLERVVLAEIVGDPLVQPVAVGLRMEVFPVRVVYPPGRERIAREFERIGVPLPALFVCEMNGASAFFRSIPYRSAGVIVG